MSVCCDSYSSINRKKAESMFKHTHTHIHTLVTNENQTTLSTLAVSVPA